ncbi:MarR family winged helix-turn-helix transcriptional regulator [Sporosarcina cyprini]|uniref:MarR family winged helix-turn-helix transcriptional regulator n=1 Tax=Sporosarcina cyprini TaxID=2910523 RepID=UPI001EE0E7A0|nr:MarR family transcriptional regulator [Sporosarcina cyprini]
MEREEIERALKLFIVLSRASKVISEEANKLIETYGLNPTEFAVLELLFHKGRQPIQKIGQKILLRSGSMTYVVDKLEKKCLLKRVFCEEDKRVTFMEITEEGKELIRSIFPSHEKNIQTIMSGLTSDEQEQAIQLLRKLGLSIKDLSS